MPPSVADEAAPPGDRQEWTDAVYDEPEIAVDGTGGAYDVTIRVTRREGAAVPASPVPFTSERYLFTLSSAVGELAEADMFGSGLAMDLDGDGETTTVLPVACEGGVGRVGEVGLPPIGMGGENTYVYYSTSGTPKVPKLGEEGGHMVLYNPCDKPPVSIGFAPPGESMTLESATGPALQVLVIEEAAGPQAAPGFTIDDVTLAGVRQDLARFLTYVYDGTADTPTWHVSRWVMVPLDPAAATQELGLRVTVEGGGVVDENAHDGPALRRVMAGLSASPAAGERRRLPLSAHPLGP